MTPYPSDDMSNGSSAQKNSAEAFVEGMEIITSFVRPLAIRAAVLLDIPDILAKAGPGATLSLTELAAQIPGQPLASTKIAFLSRLIRYLVQSDFLSQTTVEMSGEGYEAPHVRYGLTRISDCFVKKNARNLAPMLLMQTDNVFLAPWQHLDEVIVKETNGFEKAHGKGIWEYMPEHPDTSKIFNDAMASGSSASMSAILDGYNGFKDIKKLVDVGGGFGASLSTIISSYPHIHGINYDLPYVVQSAPKILGVEHVGGDMFESVPSGDAIFIKAVMHDWDDEKCELILRNVHKALPLDGKVIIADAVLASSNEKTRLNRLKVTADMIMLSRASAGGKERTTEEWQKLLCSTGFSRVSFFELRSLISVIEAFKVEYP